MKAVVWASQRAEHKRMVAVWCRIVTVLSATHEQRVAFAVSQAKQRDILQVHRAWS